MKSFARTAQGCKRRCGLPRRVSAGLGTALPSATLPYGECCLASQRPSCCFEHQRRFVGALDWGLPDRSWDFSKAGRGRGTDGNGDGGDEDGFEDRRLRLGVTFGGAGKLTGDLAAGCAAKLQAIFDALGKHRGADDWRSTEQRQHDALDEALSRLIRSGLLPQSAGTDTLAQVIIPFPRLRAWPGASPAEEQWMAGHRRAARLADRHRRRGRRLRRGDRAGGYRLGGLAGRR